MGAKQAAEMATRLIAEHRVAIFSKSYCPYCTASKNLVQGYKLPPKAVGVLELDTLGAAGNEVQAYLSKQTGLRTVPNVFINGKHVGGNSDLQTLASDGELKALLLRSP